ncbi:hypothetical protein OC842_000607 [Tilletia horrida]|uniref:DASH complex subunit DUO1 n=1 Tax=Tilletia horrida TaxID=155126 RepID=A0AAN6GGR7_9BASI|nr:hypothetical protein OC842_000607 [Tilletia horrida]
MASARPHTPTARGGSSRSAAAAQPASPNLLDNLLTTADTDADAAGAPNLADLSLTELVAPSGGGAQSKGGGGGKARPSLKSGNRGARPSWGPAAPSSTAGSQIRLLQGLGEDPLGEHSGAGSASADKSGISSVSKGSGKIRPSIAGGAKGAAGRPRFSLFTRKSLAPSQMQRPLVSSAELDEPKSLPRLSKGEGGADASTRLADELPPPAPVPAPAPAPPSVDDGQDSAPAASAAQDPSAADASHLASLDAAALRASAVRDREEALKKNLLEVRRMNEVFEGYEAMLMGSAEQIDQFASRVRITDTLLDSYIALLRDSSRTQELLLSAEWKGASADSAEAHALAVALAERETERVRQLEEQRRREAEIERRRREAELRERERAREEEERRAALVASAGAGGARGVRASTAARGGGAGYGASSARRGASTAAGAGRGTAAGRAGAGARPPVAGHTRGASASTRGGAGSSSVAGASRIGRASSIPRPPSAGGA